MDTRRKRIAKFAAGTVLALTLVADATPASAGCWIGLQGCYYRAAAAHTDWYDLWSAGIDCEIDFLRCARIFFLGR